MITFRAIHRIQETNGQKKVCHRNSKKQCVHMLFINIHTACFKENTVAERSVVVCIVQIFSQYIWLFSYHFIALTANPGIGRAHAGSFTLFSCESERCPSLSGQYSSVNRRR